MAYGWNVPDVSIDGQVLRTDFDPSRTAESREADANSLCRPSSRRSKRRGRRIEMTKPDRPSLSVCKIGAIALVRGAIS